MGGRCPSLAGYVWDRRATRVVPAAAASRHSEPPQRANVAYSGFDLGGSIVMVPDAGGDRFNVVVIYSGQQYQRELN